MEPANRLPSFENFCNQKRTLEEGSNEIVRGKEIVIARGRLMLQDFFEAGLARIDFVPKTEHDSFDEETLRGKNPRVAVELHPFASKLERQREIALVDTKDRFLPRNHRD